MLTTETKKILMQQGKHLEFRNETQLLNFILRKTMQANIKKNMGVEE